MTENNYGRYYHPRCFTIWMAGGGVKPGYVHGQTDPNGYDIVDKDGSPIDPSEHHFHPDAVHIHDLHATILHLLGLDHEKLNFKYKGRRFRLTDVHGHVVNDLLK